MPLLSGRSRPSATPSRGRPSTQASEVPAYEAPIAPLNEEAQRALHSLLQVHSTRKLETHLEYATKVVTETAGQINDAGSEAKAKHAKKRARLEANGEEQDENDLVKLEALTGRIEGLTQRLDMTMREIVDGHTFVEDLPQVVDEVKNSISGGSTQLTSTTLTQTQRRTRARAHSDERETEDPDGEATSESMQEQDVQPPAPPLEAAPSALFRSSLATHREAWSSKSLTARYSTANQYIGFYRIVHDAQHHEENAPPVPHASTWFAKEEKEDYSVLEQPPSDDEDLEVAAERVSLRCPITQLPFRDPVSSTVCPHSFERQAILQMMRRPNLPRSQRSQTETQPVKEVACPDCSTRITENDLRPDPALLRRVKRFEAAVARAREENSDDEDEDEDEPRGTQRRAHRVGSSPASASKLAARRIKEERMSVMSRAVSARPGDDPDVIPGTQMTNGGAVMVDLGADDDDDEEMD